jgi:hypothetical protein
MLRLRQICLIARDLKATIELIRAQLKTDPVHGCADLSAYGLAADSMGAEGVSFLKQAGVENVLFCLQDNFLELVSPTRADTPADRLLNRRGDGGYMVILQTQDLISYAHRIALKNIRVAAAIDSPQYASLQLHPRDVGAAMLEIAVNKSSADPRGPWYPAGGDYEARHSPALLGVDLSHPKPHELAARWSHLLSRELNTEGLSLTLDEGGRIRFVQGQEGIARIYLKGAVRQPLRIAGVEFTFQ